ncbi:sirohydrochlorin ferrochelatase [Friedmanniella endophytica]|uniref:Sirohydrochlorin ferrochelatase n=1 Tax=Microlunatus kandeliicorticis TaxID=1759536 RepID=A0A7W3ITD7_9ACTN|nr:CbiX/SirB N-terminal domain-containing protein [Microlunatus kandeliicorticis]MBA8794897.1 sirohydrochlorin ferrochelatase [Microlunatus kandeliicorticis]
MTAPSLVLLSAGGDDARAAEVSRQIRAGLTELRPDLDVHVAYVDSPVGIGSTTPSLLTVINKLVRRRVTEVVLVPLALGERGVVQDGLPQLLTAARAAHPSLRLIAARPLGPDPALLGVLDRRLRDALRVRRVSELDALVFASAGGSNIRSNALVARRARQWAGHHKLPCVTAFAHDSGPSPAEAIRTLRAQGRRHIAVGSWFLSHDEDYRRIAELAREHGAVAVSDPLGAGEEVTSAALTRFVVAAIELVDLEPLIADEPAPVRHLTVVGA